MTHSTNDVPWDTLAAHLAGELPDEERERVAAWLAADPARGELLASLRLVWGESAANRRRYDAEAMLRRVKRAPRRFSAAVPSRASVVGRVLLAASVAGLAVGGWWLASHAVERASVPAPVAAKEYRAARGQRLAVKLADGSSVLLGPASTLRIAAGYGAPARAVELEGEAYFEVTHDEARPFSVRTARALARDLGTRFIVRAYDDEPATDVAVAEGTVAVSGEGEALLTAGDRAHVSAEGRVTVHRIADRDSYFGWTDGRLVFRDTPLPDALRRIGRWYDVEINASGAGLESRTVTASFRDEPASEVVRLVAASLGLNVRRDSHAFVLTAAPR